MDALRVLKAPDEVHLYEWRGTGQTTQLQLLQHCGGFS